MSSRVYESGLPFAIPRYENRRCATARCTNCAGRPFHWVLNPVTTSSGAAPATPTGAHWVGNAAVGLM